MGPTCHRKATPAAVQRLSIPVLLFCSLHDKRRNGCGPPIGINRHIGYKSRTRLPPAIGDVVLEVNLHFYFHGSVEGPGDLGSQENDLTDADRVQEIERVDGNSYDVTLAVAMRGNGPGHIHQMHDLSAQNITERVRVIRENDFHHFRSRMIDRSALLFFHPSRL
jgi:hypothetical protein